MRRIRHIYPLFFHWISFFTIREWESKDNFPWFEHRIDRQSLRNLRTPKIDSMMKEDKLAGASDLLTWYKRLLAPIGVWPKAKNYNLRCILTFVCLAIHLTMLYADFVYHIRNLQRIIMNLSESTNFTIFLVKLALLHKNPTLGEIIDAMDEDYANDKLRNIRERKKYAAYYSMAKTFYKTLILLIYTTSFLYYLRPLGGYLLTTSSNNTTIFVLPCQTHGFYEITNVYTYALIYAYQAVALYLVSMGSVASNGLLITFIMHVCGQLAALADSIENLTKDAEGEDRYKIRTIVERHLRLIWMIKQVDNVYSIVYLGELLGIAILICMNGFNALTNSDMQQFTTLLTFIFYEATMLTILYGYCFVGECLIKESQRVHDAFYQCNWYDMPPSQSKELMICITGSEKPLYLTAGKTCIFSLELFTQVVKTAVGYISVLRTLL